MANMLRGALTGRAVLVDLVNLGPNGPRAQLLGLGTTIDIQVFAGADCVEAFTASLRAEAAAALVTELRGSLLRKAPDAALAVAWGNPSDPGPSVRRVVGRRPARCSAVPGPEGLLRPSCGGSTGR